MLNRILTIAILIGIILWLVLSYVPAHWVTLPALAFTGPVAGSALRGFAILSLLLFLLIQVYLVYATMRSVDEYLRLDKDAHATGFTLKMSWELFWTAAPIAVTIALAAASYPLWIVVASP